MDLTKIIDLLSKMNEHNESSARYWRNIYEDLIKGVEDKKQEDFATKKFHMFRGAYNQVDEILGVLNNEMSKEKENEVTGTKYVEEFYNGKYKEEEK